MPCLHREKNLFHLSGSAFIMAEKATVNAVVDGDEATDSILVELLVLMRVAGHDSLGSKRVYGGSIFDYNVSATKERNQAEMEETSLKVIDKMSRAELKRAVMLCFDYAPDATPVDRLAVLQEAQFYTQELERRRDSWTSLRDLLLEIAVIGLIGWEIWMGYRAEDLQKQNFKEEKAVLENLRDSSGETAQTLVAVKDTMGAMRLSLEKQVELFTMFKSTSSITSPQRNW
jgi:hypothetical protein